MDRRDREAPKRDPRAELRAGWELMAHAQFLEAERLCRGELLNKRGERECIDPWSLWSGPAHRAELYASEELLEFWREVSPRTDISTYYRQAAGEYRAWTDRHDMEAVSNDYVGPDAAGSVRRIASEGPQGAAVRGDSRGCARHLRRFACRGACVAVGVGSASFPVQRQQRGSPLRWQPGAMLARRFCKIRISRRTDRARLPHPVFMVVRQSS